MRSLHESGPARSLPDADGAGVPDHTRILANQLSSHMGIDAAIQISVENQWHGVVAALLELKQRRGGRG
ncbi:MAG: hypothetical protein EP335_10225 [Alphaproteobacteria bacterium]|nr:MAG: hypothetical protein EP335_10225 [Alphaproteobacteria bacterium]